VEIVLNLPRVKKKGWEEYANEKYFMGCELDCEEPMYCWKKDKRKVIKSETNCETIFYRLSARHFLTFVCSP